jgi:hypothetical protein
MTAGDWRAEPAGVSVVDVPAAGRWRVLGAVVAGLAVAAAVHARPVPPPPRPVVTTYDVTPVDAHRAYSLRTTCRDDCTLELLSTSGGRRTARPVPRLGAAPGARGRLFVLGPDEVAVDWTRPGEVRRVHSVDGGRTWGWVVARASGAVRAIPAGSALTTACVPGRTPCDHREVAVILACSGTSARLTTAPRLDDPAAGRLPASGRWWVAGREPRTHRWTTAVSTDDGRTWTVAR